MIEDIWYLSNGEPLPLFGKKVRSMRNSFLIKSLLRKNIFVRLWLPNFDHNTKKYLNSKGLSKNKKVKITLIKSLSYNDDISIRRYLHNQLIGISFIIKVFFFKKKPKMIISQIPSLELSFFGCILSKYYNIPFILDIRDKWPDTYKLLFNKKFLFLYPVLFFDKILMIKYLVKNSNSIITVSKTYLEWIKKDYGRKNKLFDKVFHIGHQKVKKSTILNNKIGKITKLIKSKFTIFFSGSFKIGYDFTHIINCAKKFINNGDKNVLFLVVGDGDMTNEIRDKLNKLRNVRMLSWQNGFVLSSLMLNSKLGIAPYSAGANMSLPNKFFEYIAHGLPILNSLSGEMNILIKKKCLGFNYNGNVNYLYKRIIFLKKNKKKLALMKKKVCIVHKKFYDSHIIYPKFFKHIQSIKISKN
jgi:hypothetical protein